MLMYVQRYQERIKLILKKFEAHMSKLILYVNIKDRRKHTTQTIYRINTHPNTNYTSPFYIIVDRIFVSTLCKI